MENPKISLSKRRTTLYKFIQISRLRLMGLLAVGLILILIGVIALLWAPAKQTFSIRFSGGIPSLNRHKIAQYFKRNEHNLNLNLELIPTEGTAEAVSRLQSGDLDAALINGLIRYADADRIRHVATITHEPMHMLVKQEYAADVKKDYSKLSDLSINLGKPNSEMNLLASSVVSFLRLFNGKSKAEISSRITTFSLSELIALIDKDDEINQADIKSLKESLPDVIIFTSALPSYFAEELVLREKYELIPLKFADAFTQIPIDEEEFDQDHVDQLHAKPIIIPAYTYGGANPVPSEDCITIGSPLILVARDDVSVEVVTRLLSNTYTGPLGRVFHPPSLEDIPLTYPLHRAAIAYRDRGKPLVRADVAEFVRELFSVLGPILGGILALYGYYRWRQVLRFIEYFRELQQIDLCAKGVIEIEGVPNNPESRVNFIENQLTLLQRQVVEDFCKNYFNGDGVLENFLALMSETRDFVRHSDAAFKTNQTTDLDNNH